MIETITGFIILCCAFLVDLGKKSAGRLLDGQTHDGMPGR